MTPPRQSAVGTPNARLRAKNMVGSTSMTAIAGAPPRRFAVTGLGGTRVPNTT